MSISVVSILSPTPTTIGNPPVPAPSSKRGYLDSTSPPSRPKKRPSRRIAPKYTRNVTRDQIKPRTVGKKAVNSAGPGSYAGSTEARPQDRIRTSGPVLSKEDVATLTVPRIDIVQASPVLGSKSSIMTVNNALERSPSMPAVLPEQTPTYQQKPCKPALTRPLTSPSNESGRTGSSTSLGWQCNVAGDTSGRIALLPLPGTPAVEHAGHDFGTSSSQGDQGAPLHTCVTDTTQSVPTTFHFQGSNTSRSTSFPGRQQADGKYTHPQAGHDCAPSSTGSKLSSRSPSLSSSVSRVTNQMRILRVTNPDPPSPGRPAALSRTPSMTIAQKRFVSCPPAPLQVERANEYKSTVKPVSSFDSPISRATGTPTSSSNSASTPSFRFSDGSRTPASVATPTTAQSSLPATPTKIAPSSTRPVDLEYNHKSLYPSAQAAAGIPKASQTCVIAPPVVRTLGAAASPSPKAAPNANATACKKAAKSDKKRRRIRRSKSTTSSRDADNSEGVESCFESIGAPSEWENVAPRKKRNAQPGRETKVKGNKVKTKKRHDDVEQGMKGDDRVVDISQKLVEKEEEPKHKMTLPKPPKSPLILTKPQVSAALDINTGRNLENLATFWTPIGRVIVAPAQSPCLSGLKMSVTPASPTCRDEPSVSKPAQTGNEAEVSSPTRAFLVPPRSPRPPNTRRLGQNDRDPLSRSELFPPHYKQDSLLVPPSADSVQNASLRLSLPLPSPMRLDAFTSELLSRCGVGHEPDSLLADLTAAPATPRRRSVDEGIKEGAKAINEQMDHQQQNKRRILPSPGDPFVVSPPQLDTYRFPSLTPKQIQNDGLKQLSVIRPSLPHTHPATLRPSTSSQANVPYTLQGLPHSAKYFSQAISTPFAETRHENRYASLPSTLPVPPPLPPRPRRNALPDASVLREQLVANGALVSGDEGGTRAKSSDVYRTYHQQARSHLHEDAVVPRGFKEHRSHRHHYKHDNDDLIIPIIEVQKPYPDGVGMMEYERAKSLRDAQLKAQMHHMTSLTIHYAIPATSTHHRPSRSPSHQLSPCARLEERLDKSCTSNTNAATPTKKRGISGYYCEEKARSGFEMLQRQSEENGYIRERGQERARGRERERRHRAVHCEDGQGKVMHDTRGGRAEQQQEAEEEEEEGEALRLGEHKRGFDSGEIERWLEGMRRASFLMAEEGQGEGHGKDRCVI
ncbi:hypothetical protein P389DRAFT_4836 [Cystobasidium minutum MCA 4210]|uniref:uncharacterized protein n=1 Tax=Cystobasidium minutum MCA 4210 TaxID=1397322 RepID=UPI0034CD3F8B|eukprot:jgi/Rhomi1/4836/CE4835_672